MFVGIVKNTDYEKTLLVGRLYARWLLTYSVASVRFVELPKIYIYTIKTKTD